MQTELDAIIEKFSADTGTIHMLGEGGVLELRAQRGIPPHVAAIVAKVPVGKGIAGLCAERNEPVSICNIQTDTSGDVRPRAKDTGVNGAIAVPIRDAKGVVKGTLGIGVHRVYEYTPAEIEALLAEAAKLAPAG